MDITIFTNHVAGGWVPQQLSSFLGGNEESLVLFSRAMSHAGHVVTVYTSLPPDHSVLADGAVTYRARDTFDFNRHYSVLITFKDAAPWMRGVDADVRVHWSNDVEAPWPEPMVSRVQAFVVLGNYHLSRMSWLPDDRTWVIPLGFDDTVFKQGEGSRDPVILYSSSPDRGLETLLDDLPLIRKHCPKHRVVATYGWSQRPGLEQFAMRVSAAGVMLAEPSQAGMAELYQRSEFWVHPLNRADSDLMGFSAMKAEHGGCTIVIPTVAVSGFMDGVRRFIPYRAFIHGSRETRENPQCLDDIPINWDNLVGAKWIPLLNDLVRA